MNEEQYLKHKPFAGPLKPSMLRRALFNDYHARRIYLLTVTTVNRYPWLGEVVGHTTAPRYTLDYPHIVPSPLGLAVLDAWRHIPDFVPKISIVDFQLMPDHLHGILFVHERMERHLGMLSVALRNRVMQPFDKSSSTKRKIPRNNATRMVICSGNSATTTAC